MIRSGAVHILSVCKTSLSISKTINAITKNGRPRCRALKLVDFEEITQFGFSSLWQRTNVKNWTACKGKSQPKKIRGKVAKC